VTWSNGDILATIRLMVECAPDGDSALSDYGIVEWKGRVLEAGFAEARLRMQHRDRGEYQDNCYVFGYVLDKEFDRARDAAVVKCNEQAAIERYKLGQRFSSRWIAEALPPSGSPEIRGILPGQKLPAAHLPRLTGGGGPWPPHPFPEGVIPVRRGHRCRGRFVYPLALDLFAVHNPRHFHQRVAVPLGTVLESALPETMSPGRSPGPPGSDRPAKLGAATPAPTAPAAPGARATTATAEPSGPFGEETTLTGKPIVYVKGTAPHRGGD
jgi:hypothetical protein